MGAENRIDDLCGHVAQAVQQIRAMCRSNFEVAEMLEGFWALQDHLHRLAETLCDDPAELLRVKEYVYPRLFTDVVDILNLSSRAHIANIAAVRRSCDMINDILLEIAKLKSPAACAGSA